MTGKRTPPLGPTTRKIRRQPQEPIGSATTAAACHRAGMAIVSLAHSVSKLLVLVDPRARVYAVPSNSDRARVYEKAHAHWTVGTFTKDAMPGDIAAAIAVTYEQLEGGAA